jgi:hypothetical protein
LAVPKSIAKSVENSPHNELKTIPFPSPSKKLSYINKYFGSIQENSTLMSFKIEKCIGFDRFKVEKCIG